jgi:hypothetical protein
LIGENLDRDVAFETRVARAIHLTHSPAADWREDLIRAEPRAWC